MYCAMVMARGGSGPDRCRFLNSTSPHRDVIYHTMYCAAMRGGAGGRGRPPPLLQAFNTIYTHCP